MKRPTCVICGCNPAMRTLPQNGIPWVELTSFVSVCSDTGEYGAATHTVCVGCAASNLEDVFEPHQEGVRRAMGDR
jgi:hypothetical protein